LELALEVEHQSRTMCDLIHYTARGSLAMNEIPHSRSIAGSWCSGIDGNCYFFTLSLHFQLLELAENTSVYFFAFYHFMRKKCNR
jgi:hypothetical protein